MNSILDSKKNFFKTKTLIQGIILFNEKKPEKIQIIKSIRIEQVNN